MADEQRSQERRDFDISPDATLRIIIESLTEQVQHSLDTTEEMRKYLLVKIEEVRNGTAQQIDSLRISLSRDYVTEVRLSERLEGVRQEITVVKDTVAKSEASIIEQIERISKAQEERQKQGYLRVIGVQAAILLAVLSGVAAVVIQILLHH